MTIDADIRKGRKFEQVLDGARDVFLRDGFDGAKVDDIARTARVSKATLYSYFPDKKRLFTEMVARELTAMEQAALKQVNFDNPPKEVLPRTARIFLSFMVEETSRKIFRISVAETERFPEIGHAFYNCGPAVMQCKMCEYLNLAIERGELRIKDVPLAAAQFAELCKSDFWLKIIFGIETALSQAEIARIADGATETFMARYGVK